MSNLTDFYPEDGTPSPTANRAMKRDAAGRCQVAAPSAVGDIARKQEVDDEASARATAISAHTNNVSNPHAVTKSQVGLGSVPNIPAPVFVPGVGGFPAVSDVSPDLYGVSFSKATWVAVHGTTGLPITTYCGNTYLWTALDELPSPNVSWIEINIVAVANANSLAANTIFTCPSYMRENGTNIGIGDLAGAGLLANLYGYTNDSGQIAVRSDVTRKIRLAQPRSFDLYLANSPYLNTSYYLSLVGYGYNA